MKATCTTATRCIGILVRVEVVLGYGELPDGYGWEFVKGGFTNFTEATCKAWVDAIADNFTDNPIGMKIGAYRSMWSPREYNFATDRISFSVEFDLRKLKKYCFKERRKAFDGYLKAHWSSCSGFWSFIPNNAYLFEQCYNGKATYCCIGKDDLIRIMVEWYLLENVDFQNVEYNVCEYENERLYENVTLCKSDDWSLWDYEYTDNGYIPTKKIA